MVVGIAEGVQSWILQMETDDSVAMEHLLLFGGRFVFAHLPEDLSCHIAVLRRRRQLSNIWKPAAALCQQKLLDISLGHDDIDRFLFDRRFERFNGEIVRGSRIEVFVLLHFGVF